MFMYPELPDALLHSTGFIHLCEPLVQRVAQTNREVLLGAAQDHEVEDCGPVSFILTCADFMMASLSEVFIYTP